MKPFHPVRVFKPLIKIRDLLLENRMNKVWSNFVQGFQDEPALVQPRVRNHEIRFLKDEIAEQQQVKIDRTGRVSGSAISSEIRFDRK